MRTREDLTALIDALVADLRDNPSAWENADLPSYLAAMSAWSGSMDQYYRNTGEELGALTVWRVMADLLMAARVYE